MPLFPEPTSGDPITMTSGKLEVPDNPIIPFIEGDGTGPDIWRASQRVLDAAVEKAYGGKRKIAWYEVYAGEKAFNTFKNWLPDETVEAYRKYLVGIKGPLTTPIGKGIRSLNVALRQMLDLYVCLRPVRWFKGVPSPVRDPAPVDMVIFRENTRGHLRRHRVGGRERRGEEGHRLPPERDEGEEDPLPRDERHRHQARLAARAPSASCAPRSSTRSSRKRKSVNIVHKGNIMKFTEGAFKNWGYALATREFRDQVVTERETWILGNKEKNPTSPSRRTPSEIEPGYDMAPPDMQAEFRAEVEAALELWETHGDGKWKTMLRIKDSHRRHHAPAGAHAPEGVRRHRHAEPQRRLPLRRARRAGRRHRHRARRQHQLRHRPRHLRGDARHRAEVRQPRQGQPRLGHPLGRDDAPAHGLGRGGRPHHQGHGRRHRRQDRHLRLRAPDGRREGGEVHRVRRRHHRAHGLSDARTTGASHM